MSVSVCIDRICQHTHRRGLPIVVSRIQAKQRPSHLNSIFLICTGEAACRNRNVVVKKRFETDTYYTIHSH